MEKSCGTIISSISPDELIDHVSGKKLTTDISFNILPAGNPQLSSDTSRRHQRNFFSGSMTVNISCISLKDEDREKGIGTGTNKYQIIRGMR